MCSMVLFHFLLLLLLSPHFGTNTTVAAARPLLVASPSTTTVKSPTVTVVVGGRKGKVGVFWSCLPKGFHRNSAPSRYINYHPLGSTTMCDTDKKH
ncbi:hypothetical protein LINGRAHAP2_LOCUS26359 [Linum grandiflorum]